MNRDSLCSERIMHSWRGPWVGNQGCSAGVDQGEPPRANHTARIMKNIRPVLSAQKIRPVLYAVFSKNTQRAYISAKNTAYIWPKTRRISGQNQPVTCPSCDAVHRPSSRSSGRRDHTWACPRLLRDARLPAVGHVACGGGDTTGSSYICPLTCFWCYR